MAASNQDRDRPLRICVLTETYHPVIGGGERQTQMLAGDLRSRGVEVCILTRRSDPSLALFEIVDGVGVHRVSPTGRGRSKRWLMVLTSFFALISLRRTYDVILVSGFKALGISAVLAARIFGKRCILKADSNGEMSGTFFASGLTALRLSSASVVFRLFMALRNAILRRADHFVAITAGIAQEFRTAGVDPEAIHLVTNGVDTANFCAVRPEERWILRRRLGLPDKAIIVTYTGRLVRYKGLPLLMRVAARLEQERGDVGFVLIGSGGLDMHNCEAELKQYVAAHGLGSAVHFAGEVPNVAEFLQASNIFAFPTEDDAFPLALVEAMACGLAVVTTPVGGICDIVTDGRDGLLVPEGDFDRLLEVLRRLIADSHEAGALGQAAATTVRARYGREIVVQHYIELFRRVSADHNGRVAHV